MDNLDHILILDDDPNLRKTLADILRLKGYAPLPIAHSQEALEAVSRGEVAIALIDLRLEDMPGLEVLRRIKASTPQVECIVLTGYASQEAAIEAVNAGAYSFLQKPYDIGQLLLVLQHAFEKRSAAKALAESEMLFRTLAETTVSAIFIYQGERFVYVNPATERLTGYTAQELLSMRFWDITHPDFRGLIRQRGLTRQKGESPPSHYEFKFIRKDGEERWVDFTAGSVEWHGQPAAIGTAFDITERVHAEEQFRQLNDSLEQRIQERTAQLEALNQELESFAHSVSHDLRAPLRAIDGFSRILAEEYGPSLGKEGNRLLNEITTSTHKMGEMIMALLNLSRLSRSEMVRAQVDMTAMAKAVYEEVATPEVRAIFSFSLDTLPPASGDATLLRQVWRNLISNAIKYTLPQTRREIHISAESSENQHTYIIRDSGVGFDPAYASKLFGVFQRLHDPEQFEGVGVGLSIVQRIVHRHGGEVWAEGQPGKGATFYFSLPQAASSP